MEPEEELSRQCAEQLLGKRNAFIPELRMNQGILSSQEDESAAAQEIIQNRLRVEFQAETLRQQKQQQQQKKNDKSQVAKASSKARTSSDNRASANAKTQRKPIFDRKASEPQYTRAKLFELEELAKPSGTKREAKQNRDEKNSNNNNNVGETEDQVRAPATRSQSRVANSRVHSDPLRQMEERQQRLREMRAIRTANDDNEPDNIPSKYVRAAAGLRNGNQDDEVCGNRARPTAPIAPAAVMAMRTERLLQEKIAKLATENQQAIEVEEQMRLKEHLRELQTRVFVTWKRQSAFRKLQDARASQVFQWRLAQKVWRNWRRIAQQLAVERVAKETRARLAREQQIEAQADIFWRERQLPKWFFRWNSNVQTRKEAKELKFAQQKRKAQAQKLVERLIRKQSRQPAEDNDRGGHTEGQLSPESDELEIDIEIDVEEDAQVPKCPPRKDIVTITPAFHQQCRSKAQPRKAAWEDKDPASASPSQSSHSKSNGCKAPSPLAPPPVNPLYVSMQARVVERKQRRDLLKQKYKQLEHEKREALAMQVAEREAQVLQAKLHERERIRERKRQEALAAQDKLIRIEVLEAQRRRARRHDYTRLVFFYGFLPLKRQWELSKRIAVNATQWHELRVLHSNWHHWLQFVRERRVERQKVERQKLAIAAQHHALSLKRQSLRGFKLLHQHMLSTELAVQRQSQWNALRRAWSSWQRTYVVICMRQQVQERQAVAKLNGHRLQRVWLQWRLAVAELREERERQQEKQRLWGKVRNWLNE